MSPRRKIALWLCPELGERPVAQVDYYPSAQGWVRDTLRNAEAATDAAWKAEVLELLKALNASAHGTIRATVVNTTSSLRSLGESPKLFGHSRSPSPGE